MATSSRKLTRSTLLPPAATAFLRRRSIEGSGMLLAFVGLGAVIALATFHPGDPSLNAAAGREPLNLLGGVGAMFADVMMQTIGAASWLLPVTVIAWGWRIATRRGLGRLWLRLSLLPLALVLTAIALAGLDAAAGWPLEAGYGGIVGDIVLAKTMPWSAGLTPLGADAVALVASVLALAAALTAPGFSREEWQKLGHVLMGLSRRGARAGAATAVTTAAAGGQAGRFIGRWSLKTASQGRAAAALLRREPRLTRAAGGDLTDVAPSDEDAVAFRAAPVDDMQDAAEGNVTPRLAARKERLVAARPKSAKPGPQAQQAKQSTLKFGPDGIYQLPDIELLEPIPPEMVGERADEDALSANARLLESVLEDFGVQGKIMKVRPGPVVTLYEFEPAPGIKSSRVIGLANDVARSMSAVSARIATVPGRNVMGIELPNSDREIVALRELLESETIEKMPSKLSLALGKDIGGGPVIADLSRMPHLLIAGTTGSGKSVAINTMILSLLYRLSPAQCRMVMIDPKMLELSVYDGIPHLLTPVVTDPKKAVVALRWTVREMEDRYRAMSTLGVRNIANYNSRLEEAVKSGEALTRTVQTGFDSDTGEPVYEDQPLDMTQLPYIVVIVDEMADLMLVAGKEVESSVQRIAQMARAAGIHLIMATQRPSVDVITGTIKANFPTRISFQVTSKIDSRTILGEGGAEQLLGQGDMLYMASGGRLMRVHGPLVTDEEVDRVVSGLKAQGAPDYVAAVTDGEPGGLSGFGSEGGGEDADDLYDMAVAVVCRERKASTSFVQRHLKIGYNRAARIVDQMEAEGVISAANHVGKREVLARNLDDPED
jgi:S-DNA-T family DNA segregation ATPase FtsK/SpoIIIE